MVGGGDSKQALVVSERRPSLWTPHSIMAILESPVMKGWLGEKNRRPRGGKPSLSVPKSKTKEVVKKEKCRGGLKHPPPRARRLILQDVASMHMSKKINQSRQKGK